MINIVTQPTPLRGKMRQSRDSNADFWSCFLNLWDPGNPPSFCKRVSSSLRSLSSSWRRSFSSFPQTASIRKLETDCGFSHSHKITIFERDKAWTPNEDILVMTLIFLVFPLIPWDPGTSATCLLFLAEPLLFKAEPLLLFETEPLLLVTGNFDSSKLILDLATQLEALNHFKIH